MSFFEPKTPKNQGINAHSEHGGALIWIMIMVALFASLSYVMSQGSRGGTAQIGDKQAELAATEILDYARSIKNAVHQLQINGCSDTEISFDQAVVSGYSNPNSPSDNSCHVFHSNGGGLRYLKPKETVLDTSKSANSYYGLNIFWGHTAAYNFGSVENELILVVNYINKESCIKINDHFNITNPSNDAPADSTTIGAGSLYTGTFSTSVGDPIGNDATGHLNNKTSFCVKRSDAVDLYQFYQILIAR